MFELVWKGGVQRFSGVAALALDVRFGASGVVYDAWTKCPRNLGDHTYTRLLGVTRYRLGISLNFLVDLI